MLQANLSGLVPLLKTIPSYRELVRQLKARAESDGQAVFPALGLIEAARAIVVAALQRDLGRTLLVITADSDRARQVFETVRVFAHDPESILLFPAPDVLPYERVAWEIETVCQRLRVLSLLHAGWRPQGEPNAYPATVAQPVIVAPVRALLQRTLPPAEFDASVQVLRQGQSVDLRELLWKLQHLGYRHVPIVEEPGQFSRRGGIVDVYPPAANQPARIEFFGDEIESLRLFDPATQRSAEKVLSLTVTPATEALPGRGPEVARRMRDWDWSSLHPLAQGDVERQRENLAQGVAFPGIEFYGAYLHPTPATMLDYLTPDAQLLVDNWRDLEAEAVAVAGQAMTLREAQVRAGELPAAWDAVPLVGWDQIEPQIRSRRPTILGFDARAGRHPVGDSFVPSPRYGGQLKEVVSDTVEWQSQQRAIVIVTRQAPRLAELFEEYGIYAAPVSKLSQLPQPGTLTIVQGVLGEGWTLQTEGGTQVPRAISTQGRNPLGPWVPGHLGTLPLVLLTDSELFGWRMPRRRRVQPRQVSPPDSFFTDLRPGDYVVHIEHGIGQFRGLLRMNFGGVEREYIELEYARGDRLYVPTYQLDRVARYVGVGDAVPEVTRLGSADWERVKEKAKRAIEEIARELLELYSRREISPGHAFSPDTPWQAELEASFPHVETEDQLRVIEEVKKDMEESKPMDRLVAGDVGFGKTEVALRAAFKAVMDGKQVAILVPTTVLAQQHLVTFQQRLAAFPINVEMLSRFKSKPQQQEILERLKAGQIDIIIGTHRLLQPDVEFKDLGLLVIDEEHRFGVVDKERLKELRATVDVLTLTATPIPRTLHMSLTGIRDLSTIETPPEERLPVRTYVAELDEELVRQAILRELNRGGQVYIVYNRVMGIHLIAQKIERLVPEAVVGVAHGQMDEDDLAQVMLDFASGRIDILVCTSIVESGLDIPNANTLIVLRADRFGLAQLYQLRGRVGRSNRRAYAYFLYEKHQELSDDARKRLETIQEASDLGSGFRLAMKDLEIRGAGDILGTRQSGHIAAIGFDLYTRLLAQTIRELKADGVRGHADAGAERRGDAEMEGDLPAASRPRGPVSSLELAPTIDVPLAAYLPDEYVSDARLRLQLYRRMAEIKDLRGVQMMSHELEDRFGELPQPVRNLMFLLQLKVLATQARVQSVGVEGDNLLLKLEPMDKETQMQLSRRLNGRVRVGRQNIWIPMRSSEDWREDLRQVLEKMAND